MRAGPNNPVGQCLKELIHYRKAHTSRGNFPILSRDPSF